MQSTWIQTPVYWAKQHGVNRKTIFGVLVVALAFGVVAVSGASTVATFTTDSDFQGATELTNLSIEGSGQGADLVGDIIEDGTTATRPVDDEAHPSDSYRGIRIQPTEDLDAIEFQISNNVSGANQAAIADGSGNIITSQSCSCASGDTVRFDESLSAGTEYQLLVNAGDSEYTSGEGNGLSHPYSSDYVDIIAGQAVPTTQSSTQAWNVRSVTGIVDVHASQSTYVSQEFGADQLTEGTVDITLSNADATVTWQHYDGGSWTDITQSTYSSTGEYTESFGAEYDRVRAVTTFTPTDRFTAESRLHDASVRFESEPPTVDNSNASPQGGERPADENITLSIPVSDVDFATSQGDELQVEWYRDGSKIGEKSYATNTTAELEASAGVGGEREWHVVVTDNYGNTVTSDTFTYTVPSKLYLREETNPSQLLSSPVTATIRFYGDDQSYERTSTDGTVNMTGLPVNQTFTVSASTDSTNWTDRTIIVENIYEQQSVYLLNSSEHASVEARFVLEDATGQYDSQSTLHLQKSITQNGTTEWRTIYADSFGVEGVTATLEEGIRYRTKIVAEDGSTQIVGPYRGEVSETVSVQPGAPTVDIPSFNEGYGYNADIINRTVEYRYADPENETDQVTVWIHEKGNESNQLVANSTFYDVGSVYRSFDVSENESKKTWLVNYVIERNGETMVQSREIANQKQLFDPLAPGLQAAVGVTLLLLLGGAFSVLNSGVGAVVVSITGGILWWVGLLSGVASAILIAIAIFVAVIYHIARSSGP